MGLWFYSFCLLCQSFQLSKRAFGHLTSVSIQLSLKQWTIKELSDGILVSHTSSAIRLNTYHIGARWENQQYLPIGRRNPDKKWFFLMWVIRADRTITAWKSKELTDYRSNSLHMIELTKLKQPAKLTYYISNNYQSL